MRIKQARLGDKELAFAQEDWEGGFTLFLPDEISAGQTLDLALSLEGDFMYDAQTVENCHTRVRTDLLPRHGISIGRLSTDVFAIPKNCGWRGGVQLVRSLR